MARLIQNVLADLDFEKLDENLNFICSKLLRRANSALKQLRKLSRLAPSGTDEKGFNATLRTRIEAVEQLISSLE